ncbi:hypothetical protein [Actinoallomurus soli]|nr:hypothetical protein [Actinoallomurus soli]
MIVLSAAAIVTGITALGTVLAALTIGRRRPAYRGRHRALW